jgi:hypothetical protein
MLFGFSGGAAYEAVAEDIGDETVPGLTLQLEQVLFQHDFFTLMCEDWLIVNFNLRGRVREASIIEPSEIDRALNLIPVKFYFTTEDGVEGDSVAHFAQAEIYRLFML